MVSEVCRLKTNLDDIKLDQSDDRFILDKSYAKVIAEWEHYAVLTLFDIEEFDADILDISNRLGITKNRVEVVLNNLLTSGLIEIKDELKFSKVHSNIRTIEDVTSKALKDSHIETLEMGKNKLEKIEVELRDFSTMTIAMDLKRIPEVKTIIREFRQKMSVLLRDGKKNGCLPVSYSVLSFNKNFKTLGEFYEKFIYFRNGTFKRKCFCRK